MKLVLIGAVCGLAWAAGLRGFMAEVAGPASVIEWGGTFRGILLPGMVAGGLLGWAERLRRVGGGRGRRWLALAPLAFIAATPEVLVSVFVDGLGGGAIAILLFGMAGGYALSGRGRLWARIACGVVALVPVPGWALAATLVGGSTLGLDTARGAWVAVYFISFLAVLAIACAIPHRPASPQEAVDGQTGAVAHSEGPRR